MRPPASARASARSRAALRCSVPCLAKLVAAATVPCSVRKSLAVNSPRALLHIGVDVRSYYRMPDGSVFPRQQPRVRAAPLQCSNHRSKVGIRDFGLPLLAALRRKIEKHRFAAHRGVGAEQGRKAMAAIRLGILLRSDAEGAGVEHAERSRQGSFARRLGRSQVHRDPAPRGGKRLGEPERPIELYAVLLHTPARVIEVLPATGSIHARRLDMSVGVGRDPNLRPSQRDPEMFDANSNFWVGDRIPACVCAREPAAFRRPAQSGTRGVTPAQSGHTATLDSRVAVASDLRTGGIRVSVRASPSTGSSHARHPVPELT